MEEDGSDLDEEELAMINRKFMKLFKKAKENAKKKSFSKSRNNDREQFAGCFKCGKYDHIVKNCPLLKEEQESEQFKKQGGNSPAKRFSKAMLAAWGDSTEDEERLKRKMLLYLLWPEVTPIQMMNQQTV